MGGGEARSRGGLADQVIRHPVRVFVVACLLMVAAITLVLTLQYVHRAMQAPGSSCTIVYPDGSTRAGQVQSDGRCQPVP